MYANTSYDDSSLASCKYYIIDENFLTFWKKKKSSRLPFWTTPLSDSRQVCQEQTLIYNQRKNITVHL